MPTTHTYEEKLVVPQTIAITDPGLNYFDARNQAATAKEFKGLTLTNMPRLIELLQNEKISKAIRESYVDTTSAEFHSTIKGERIYAVAHGDLPFLSVKRLKEGVKNQDQYGFIPLTAHEAKILFKSMVPIGDVRSGYDASNQTIAINLDKDNPVINPRGQLDYNTWMNDDRVLAACGNKENRQFLGEFLFKTERKRDSVGSYHRIQEKSFDQPVGRLVVLRSDDNGINRYYLNYSGRSVGSSISARGASARAISPLEQLAGRGHIIEGTNNILITDPSSQEYKLLTGKALGGK